MILVAAATIGAASAGAATGHQPSKTLVENGPVRALEEHCAKGALDARVTIPRLEFAPAQAVTVHATIRNVSADACTFSASPRGPSSVMGPCGSVSMEIKNSNGTNVWPGTVPYMCPLMTSFSLPAGGHFAATGSWDQLTAVDPHQAPPGRYRLVVGGTLTFSITIS
jgi:hypothetical protein